MHQVSCRDVAFPVRHLTILSQLASSPNTKISARATFDAAVAAARPAEKVLVTAGSGWALMADETNVSSNQ